MASSTSRLLRSRVARLGLVAGLATTLALATAVPAMAAAPDGTAVITDLYLSPPYSEVGVLVVNGSCDAASYAAEVHYENLTTGDVGYYFQNLDVDKNFTFAEDPLNNMGDPGEELSVWIVCVLLDNTPTATSAAQNITLVDLGTSISVPTVTAGQTMSIFGSCGSAPSVTHVEYVVFDLTTETLIAEGSYATTGGPFVISGIPSTGFTPPAEGYAAFRCISSGEGDEVLTEWRDTTFSVVAAAPALANTGFPAVPIALMAGVLALGGALLVGVRRMARA